MDKKTKRSLEKIEKLDKENKKLRQQLREANTSIEAIQSGGIDALVISDEKALKVYTQKNSDKTYRTLIEKMNEGAVTLDEDGTILYCNSYFAKLINLPLQKVIGTKFNKFFDDPAKAHFEILLKKGRRYATKKEIYINSSGGKPVAVLMSITTLWLDNKYILGIILTDLTIQNKHKEELKRRASQLECINRELESANKDLTSFTYLSSHDLQEPLRKIQNFALCILLEEEKNLSETGKGYFERMRQAAKRMQALIEDLLIYSQTSSNERKFAKTDLNIIVSEVKKDYEEEIQEKNATIETSNLCDGKVIPFQFRQLMHNLIGNSLKFAKRETAPHIVIKAEIVKAGKLNNCKLSEKTGSCHITYTDNGIGFAPQYNERIFEVFQRLHSQEEYKGTGMGLAICKRIIENHNGTITASGKLNKGARFDIYIPAL